MNKSELKISLNSNFGLYGLVDEQKNLIIPYFYEYIVALGDYFVVMRENKVGLLDAVGRILIPCNYLSIETISENDNKINGRIWIFEQNYNRKGQKFGIGISPEIRFSELLLLKQNMKMSLFSFNKGIILEADKIVPIENSMFFFKVYSKDLFKLFDALFGEIKEDEYEDIRLDGKILFFKQKNLWGAKAFPDNSEYLSISIPAKYKELHILHHEEGSLNYLFYSKSHYESEYVKDKYDYYTILDDHGNSVLNNWNPLIILTVPEYIEGGLIRVAASLSPDRPLYGCINLSGDCFIPFRYEELNLREDGNFDAKIGNRWGIIDKMGREIVTIKYSEPIKFSLFWKNKEDKKEYEEYRLWAGSIYLFSAKKDKSNVDVVKEKQTIISKAEKLAIVKAAPDYYKHSDFENDSEEDLYFNEKYGVIDDKGKEILPISFANIGFSKDVDFIFACQNPLDYGGSYREYDSFDIDHYTSFRKLAGSIQVKDPRWAIFTRAGKRLTPFKYNDFLFAPSRDHCDYYSGKPKYVLARSEERERNYDLYNLQGELLISGFTDFYFDIDYIFLYFGGKRKTLINKYGYRVSEFYRTYKGGWIAFNEKGVSLIPDKDLSEFRFQKGLKITFFEYKDENGKKHLTNDSPINLFQIPEDDKYPRFSNGYLLCGIPNHDKNKFFGGTYLLRTKDMTQSQIYDEIIPINSYPDLFFAKKEVEKDYQENTYAGIISLTTEVVPLEYLILTSPIEGCLFGIKEAEDWKYNIFFIDINGVAPKVTIAYIELDDLSVLFDGGLTLVKVNDEHGAKSLALRQSSIITYEHQNNKRIRKEIPINPDVLNSLSIQKLQKGQKDMTGQKWYPAYRRKDFDDDKYFNYVQD